MLSSLQVPQSVKLWKDLALRRGLIADNYSDYDFTPVVLCILIVLGIIV
jgi:hypothetical protein